MKMSLNKFFLMVALHFSLMYVLMYAMVDSFNNVFNNLNQIYMAAIMTTPMVILEVVLMGEMYKKKKFLWYFAIASVVLFFGFFYSIRKQVAITNMQFLKSMIPHHGGAILMCKNELIDDPEIIELCKQITESQEREISQMKQIMERLQ